MSADCSFQLCCPASKAPAAGTIHNCVLCDGTRTCAFSFFPNYCQLAETSNDSNTEAVCFNDGNQSFQVQNLLSVFLLLYDLEKVLEVGWLSSVTLRTNGSTLHIFNSLIFILILERGRKGEERNIDLLSHLLTHSLVDSCMCPHWGSNNLGRSGQCSHQRGYLARATFAYF